MRIDPCRTCRGRERHLIAPNHLCCPDAALDLTIAAVATSTESETMVFLLDGTHTGSDVICVTDARTAAQVHRCVSLVLGVSPGSYVEALFVVTVRPGHQGEPNDADLETWFELRSECDDLGIDLLDWVIVTRLHAGQDRFDLLSVGAYTQSSPLWRMR